MSIRDVLVIALTVPFVPGVLAMFFLAHWMGYLCGLVYGISEELLWEFVDQFRLGRHHMTGEGGDRP